MKVFGVEQFSGLDDKQDKRLTLFSSCLLLLSVGDNGVKNK
jgi:hypothetical protein